MPLYIAANSHSFLFGKDVLATGWGLTKSGFPNLLQQAQLKVANETFFSQIKDINSLFEPTEQYAVIEDLPDNNPDTNVCRGDSGGPLVFFDDNKWTIYRVTSYAPLDSFGNCIANLPSYFQSVPFYSNFINSYLNSSSKLDQKFPFLISSLFLLSIIFDSLLTA